MLWRQNLKNFSLIRVILADLLSVLLDQRNIYLEYYQEAQLMVECNHFYLHHGNLNIFHFYIGRYLWKKTTDGKLINKRLKQNWKYGNNKFFFLRTDAMNYDNDCSASNGICFLADTLIKLLQSRVTHFKS